MSIITGRVHGPQIYPVLIRAGLALEDFAVEKI